MCIRNHSESGQPCGFEPCEAYKRLEEENAALRQERDALIQVSADVCPDCGWAMKFPDEPCRNCEVVALRKVVEKADVLAADVLANCEDCCERCEECVFATAAQKAKIYQGAHHG